MTRNPSRQPPAPRPLPEDGAAPRHRTVLVINDQDDHRKSLHRLLEKALPDHSIISASNGAAGGLARAQTPELVLVETHPSGSDGAAICRRLKADPVSARIPVLLIAGDGRPAEAGGADGIICRPFESGELVSQIRSMLNRPDRAPPAPAPVPYPATEDQLRLLFDHSPDAIFVEDEDGVVLLVSEAACRLHGMTREELIGRNMLELVPPEYRDVARQNQGRLIRNELESVEGFSRTRDGRDIPVELRAKPIQFAGRPAVLLHVRDVRERHRAQEALMQVAMVCDAMEEAVMMTSRHGEVLEMNPAAERLTGWTAEELAGRPLPWFAEGPDAGAPGATIRRALEQEGVWRGEAPYTPRAGAPITLGLIISRIYNRAGEWIANMSIGHDVTEQKQSEQALRESERRYRLLYEQMPMMHFTVDDAGCVLMANPAAVDQLGYPLDELVGRPVLGIFHPDDRAGVERLLAACRAEPDRVATWEFRKVRKDGAIIWVSETTRTIRLHDGRLVFHILCEDITREMDARQREKKLQERLALAQRMESLGLLAGGVAHDLNNILGPLVGYPDLILANLPPDSPVRHDLQEIRSSARRAAEVIQDLLTLSRRGSYQLEPVDLNALIHDYLHSPEWLALRHQHPGVELDLRLDSALAWMQGSRPHLTRVLANLVTNACEAMAGVGTLTLATGNAHPDPGPRADDAIPEGDYVTLRVSDTGVGIAAEDIHHIFEPFFTRRKSNRGGTGLGLAVVYGVVKDLQGHIDVASALGQGARFSLYFPVAPERPAHAEASPVDMTGTESVLVVDDVKEQRELCHKLLARLGYRVQLAANGWDAIAQLKQQPFDLVLLDMILEEGPDGLDTYREMLKLRPGQPCVVMSGFAETGRVREAMRLGAGAYLRKPFTLEKLGVMVRQTLDQHRSRPAG